MLYLNEEDIIRLIAEKCNDKPENVTLKVEIPEATITAIVDKKPEDDGLIVVRKDRVDPGIWDLIVNLLKQEGNCFIFRKKGE